MRLVIALAFLGAACQERPRSASPDQSPQSATPAVVVDTFRAIDTAAAKPGSARFDTLWSTAIAPGPALFDTLWAIARNRTAARSRLGEPLAVTSKLEPDVDDTTLTDTVVSWKYNGASLRFLVLDEDVLAEARMGTNFPMIARLAAPFRTLSATRARLDKLWGFGRLSKGSWGRRGDTIVHSDTNSYSLTVIEGDYLHLYFLRDSLVLVGAEPFVVSAAPGRLRTPPLEALRIGPHRIRFDSITFADAGRMLGSATIRQTGPEEGQEEGLISVCYRAGSPAGGTSLVLQAEGDVETPEKDVRPVSFALGAAKSFPRFERQCADLQFPSDQIVTDRGIKLGMPRADVERILGTGTPAKSGMVEYSVRRTFRTASGGERLFSRLQVWYRGDSVVRLLGRRTR